MTKPQRPVKPWIQARSTQSTPKPANSNYRSLEAFQPAEDPDWDEWDDVDPPDDLSEPWSLPEDDPLDEPDESEPQYGDFCIDCDDDDE